MPILTIDTSTKYASVSLMLEDGNRFCSSWYTDQNHGAELMVEINKIAKKSKITLDSLSHITVCLGPGGFSAIRTGISVTLGLAMGTKSTLYGVNTHVAEVWHHTKIANQEIISILPASKTLFSWALINSNHPTEILDTGLDDLNTIKNFKNSVLFCGESSVELKGKINEERIVTKALPSRAPNILLDLSKIVIENKSYCEAKDLRPIYSRPPNISKPKNISPIWSHINDD